MNIKEALKEFSKSSRKCLYIEVKKTNLHFEAFHDSENFKIELRLFNGVYYKSLGLFSKQELIFLFDGLEIKVNEKKDVGV